MSFWPENPRGHKGCLRVQRGLFDSGSGMRWAGRFYGVFLRCASGCSAGYCLVLVGRRAYRICAIFDGVVGGKRVFQIFVICDNQSDIFINFSKSISLKSF